GGRVGENVQRSQYAEILGIPVALLGLLCFIALFGLAVIRIIEPERADIITMIMFVMVVGSIGFYIYLTYLELFVIEAICQWFVASSLLMVGMLVTESILLRRVLSIPGE